jgi:hypothetical protein
MPIAMPVAMSSGSLGRIADMAATRQLVVRLDRPEQLFTADAVNPMSSAYTEFTAQPAMDTVRDILLMRTPAKAADIELLLILPPDQVREGLEAELTEAVRRWVRVQNLMDVEQTGAGGAIGRRLFLLGVLAFLLLQTTSLVVKQLGDRWDNDLVTAIGEGLSVTSWVMLWFPVQIFTVEAWRNSIRRRRAKVIERMTVRVQASNA